MSDTGFGDLELADVYDTEPVDPLQLAIRIHRLRRYISALAGIELGEYFDLTEAEQADALDAATKIAEWVGDHPTSERAQLARVIHEFRRAIDPGLAPWVEISAGSRVIADAIARDLADWMIRQGSWR